MLSFERNLRTSWLVKSLHSVAETENANRDGASKEVNTIFFKRFISDSSYFNILGSDDLSSSFLQLPQGSLLSLLLDVRLYY